MPRELGDARGAGILLGVGGVEPADVGEQHQQVGVEADRHARRQAVVVAEPTFVATSCPCPRGNPPAPRTLTLSFSLSTGTTPSSRRRISVVRRQSARSRSARSSWVSRTCAAVTPNLREQLGVARRSGAPGPPRRRPGAAPASGGARRARGRASPSRPRRSTPARSRVRPRRSWARLSTSPVSAVDRQRPAVGGDDVGPQLDDDAVRLAEMPAGLRYGHATCRLYRSPDGAIFPRHARQRPDADGARLRHDGGGHRARPPALGRAQAGADLRHRPARRGGCRAAREARHPDHQRQRRGLPGRPRRAGLREAARGRAAAEHAEMAGCSPASWSSASPPAFAWISWPAGSPRARSCAPCPTPPV